ncbi:MAG: inositol phosphorylceramide synthase [Chloroflexi bacterium]|nr:MAG: inositol phosphorylceramide synthase [Chloroflexota bacterium]
MSTAVAAGRRVLPRGYADFARQLLIWFGFVFAYQLARGLADRNPSKAFVDGWRILDFEQRVTNHVFELTLQQFAISSSVLSKLVSWTYWNSEFTVVGLALLWVYLRRHEAFSRFRNAIIGANLVGLIGYILLPTAPPRMFPSIGFIDHHKSGVVELAANPYAAMPSLHAADALIVGLVLASLVRRPVWKVLWLVWPLWVCFAVMATGNHFWLDVLAGIALGSAAMYVVYRRPVQRLIARLL